MFQRLCLSCGRLFCLILFIAVNEQASAQNSMKQTASGLRYSIVKPGKGNLPVKGSQLSVLYTLKLASNDSIITTYNDAAKPFHFLYGEGAVLPGLNEAAGLLKPGGEINVEIPPTLGYGSRRVGKIPPSSTLTANLKLLSFVNVFYPYEKQQPIVLGHNVKKYLIRKGRGAYPGRNDDVMLKFTGYYLTADGNRKIFDQSPHNQTVSFQRNAGQLLQGLETAIASMKEGEMATFIIQPEAAFGNQQRGEVPPNTVVMFDVELTGFKNPFFDFSATDTVTLNNGLQLIWLKRGAGAHPGDNDIVSLQFVSYFMDEDSNRIIYDRTVENHPYRLRVGNKNSIEGLRMALRQMRPGAALRAIIPAPIAYGEKTVGRIPPGSTIFYDIEMKDTVQPIRFLHGAQDSIVDKSGVVVYPFTDGKGSRIEEGSMVLVHFNGYYLNEDGHEVIFESTPEKGNPFQFVFGKDAVLEGWKHAFQYLKEGQLAKIFIPAKCAYGAKGVDQVIPPNTDIYFDLQVLKVVKQPAN